MKDNSLDFEIPDEVYDLMNQRYQIVDHLIFSKFDSDFDTLKTRLQTCKKDTFDPDDKIIIEHLDTDYYFEECTVGIHLRNLFLIIEELDIPRNVFVFYTNHFGIKKEIDSLCKHCHENDRPLVIESFLSKLYDHRLVTSQEHDIDKITHHALCMMYVTRSHRNAVYHALQTISPDILVLNAQFKTHRVEN